MTMMMQLNCHLESFVNLNILKAIKFDEFQNSKLLKTPLEITWNSVLRQLYIVSFLKYFSVFLCA